MATAISLVSTSTDHQVKAFEGNKEETLAKIKDWFESMGEYIEYEEFNCFYSDVCTQREALDIFQDIQNKYLED